jgi:SAM-dependent methyltransferase
LIEFNDCRVVCEVGAGANPALDLEYICDRGLRYCIMDVSEEELAKAPDGYHKIVADICRPLVPGLGPFDLVFSKMLAEHIREPEQFHRNVHRLLRPGGVAFHFFPTLYALPFVVNLLLPEVASTLALRLLSPRDEVRHGKFPAYYRWCRGPTKGVLRKLENVGYIVEEYAGFFGHNYYRRIPLMARVHAAVVTRLLRHPLPFLTSYAYAVLRKPLT